MTYPNGITLDLDFTQSTVGSMTFTRAGNATDGFYTDAAGSSYNTYTSNVPRYSSTWGLIYEPQARTSYVLNSAAPITQTTGSLPISPYVLWVIGTGSATITAGTGVATGLGTATPGTPLFLSVTTAGTFVVTVTGSLNRFQLERGNNATSFIVTAGAIATRPVETCTLSLGAWYNSAAGTLLCAASMPFVTANTNNLGWASLDDNTVANRICLSQNPVPQFIITAASVSQVNVGGTPSLTSNTIQRLAARYNTAAGTARSAANGGLMTAQTGKTIPVGAITQLSLPQGATANFGATTRIQRVQYWPFELSDADLQAATLDPGVAAVSSTGDAGAATGRSTTLPSVRPTVRGYSPARGQSTRTVYGGQGRASPFARSFAILSPTPVITAVVYGLARSILRGRLNPSFLAPGSGAGRQIQKGRATGRGLLSAQTSGTAIKPKGRGRATFNQSVAASAKAVARARTSGAGALQLASRGRAFAKGTSAPLRPSAIGSVVRPTGRARPNTIAGVRARGAAILRGSQIIAPQVFVTFWQRLSQVYPSHQLNEKTRVIQNQFGDGYQQTIADGITPIVRTLTLTWDTLERGDVDTMLLFFRTYAGIPITFVAPRDTGPRHWLPMSWTRSYPQPHADSVTVQFEERLYVERSLLLNIAGRNVIGIGILV